MKSHKPVGWKSRRPVGEPVQAVEEPSGYLFDMPERSGARELSGREQMEAFESDSRAFGGLFRVVDAARVFGVADGTVRTLIKRGRLQTVWHFGAEWVTGDAVRERLANPPKTGRPRKRVVVGA